MLTPTLQNPAGTAPFFRDSTVTPPITLGESGAIVEYILAVHAPHAPGTRLARAPTDPDFAPYLQYLHWSNATLQANISRNMTLLFAGQIATPVGQNYQKRLAGIVGSLDAHLATHAWLAGPALSAADVMAVFSLTTMRGFYPLLDLGPYAHVQRWLKDVAARPAYREALRKGDKGMAPMIEAKVGGFLQFGGFGAAIGANVPGVKQQPLPGL